MRKVVRICDKDYSMKSSAYTQFKYRNDTGRRLLDDVQHISSITSLPEEEQAGKMEEVIELLLRLAFVMIEEADKTQVSTFDDFLKSIDGLFDNTEWINEVVDLAISPISRGIQTHSPLEQ